MRDFRGLFGVLGVFLFACGGGTAPDAGAGLDAASADAGGGSADGGVGMDGGSGTDAGGGDAGAACAGAVLDEPCTVEGTTCGGPCTDPCSFCNLLTCTGGTWNRVEVFPTPCFACGESLRCVTAEQHCVRSYSDVGGVPDSFSCADNPADCRAASATCACLDATLAFDECVEPSAGEVEIRYFGG